MENEKPNVTSACTKWVVWILRLIVGAVFIISGFAKADDIYGFIFKIDEYLEVWNFVQPRSLVLFGASSLSIVEFLLGCMLLLGCYRRSCVWLMTLMMAVMLPLTAYLFFADPVPDCGCFGDFIKLSNGATFLKNIFLTAALVYLIIYNKRVDGLFGAYIQWLVAALCFVYILIIGMVGYMIQPLVDFRSFPVGTSLISEEDDDDSEFVFVYEKDGARKEFAVTELPDSTWTFVERKQLGEIPVDKTELVIMDSGENVTADVIASEGSQLLVLIPDYSRADVSNTYLLNLLDDYVKAQGGSIMTLMAADAEKIEEWKDLSMADYPVYYVEPTILKEMARGIMPVVYLRDGVIEWKRTLPSIDSDLFEDSDNKPGLLDTLAFDGTGIVKTLTIALVSFIILIFLLDRSGRLLAWSIKIRKKARSLKYN